MTQKPEVDIIPLDEVALETICQFIVSVSANPNEAMSYVLCATFVMHKRFALAEHSSIEPLLANAKHTWEQMELNAQANAEGSNVQN